MLIELDKNIWINPKMVQCVRPGLYNLTVIVMGGGYSLEVLMPMNQVLSKLSDRI